MKSMTFRLKSECVCTMYGGPNCFHNQKVTVLRQFRNGRYLVQNKHGWVRAVHHTEVA